MITVHGEWTSSLINCDWQVSFFINAWEADFDLVCVLKLSQPPSSGAIDFYCIEEGFFKKWFQSSMFRDIT